MRENEIKNALSFLQNPRTKDASLSEKVNFLEQKGLTSDEISEALSRFDSGTNETSTGSSLDLAHQRPINSVTNPPGSSKSGNGWLMAAGTFGGIAAGLTGAGALLYHALTPERSQQVVRQTESEVNAGQGPDSDMYGENNPQLVSEVERASEEILPQMPGGAPFTDPSQDHMAAEVARLSEAVEKQADALQQAVKAMNDFVKEEKERRRHEDASLSSAISSYLMNQTASLRADMVSVRRMLEQTQLKGNTVHNNQNDGRGASKVDEASDNDKTEQKQTTPDLDFFRIAKKANGSEQQKNGNDGKEDSDQSSKEQQDAKNDDSEEKAKECISEFRMEKMCSVYTALKTLQEKNEVVDLEKGSKMLIMYFKNLLDHPTIPRYRRVSSSNSSFQNFVSPLQGHKELFKAAGFIPRGSALNFEWHSFDDTNKSEIITEVLQAVVDGLTQLGKGEELSMKDYEKKPVEDLSTASGVASNEITKSIEKKELESLSTNESDGSFLDKVKNDAVALDSTSEKDRPKIEELEDSVHHSKEQATKKEKIDQID